MTIPDESLKYHAIRNDISTWLMARAEINLAKNYVVTVLVISKVLMKYAIYIYRFEASKLKKLRGRIIRFSPKLVNSNRYITLLGEGSLGGKRTRSSLSF